MCRAGRDYDEMPKSKKPQAMIDAAFTAFKDEASRAVEDNYVHLAYGQKEFERLVKKLKTASDTRVAAEAECMTSLKQGLAECKNSIKQMHALEQKAISEIGEMMLGEAKAVTARSRRILSDLTTDVVPGEEDLGLGDDD